MVKVMRMGEDDVKQVMMEVLQLVTEIQWRQDLKRSLISNVWE